jgi:hypothetical protein
MAQIITYPGTGTASLFWCVTDIIGKAAAVSPNASNETGTNVSSSGETVTNLAEINGHPSVSSTPLLKKAVSDQSIFIYGTKKETTGLCARYSYNIAYKIKDHITTKSSGPIIISTLVRSGGNADEAAHRKAIMNLGIYDQYYLGEFTGKQLKSDTSIIKTTNWQYGDMLNYYAPCCSGISFMHTQIYTGDIWKKGINGDGTPNAAGNSGWSTSAATNYGTSFVYSADNKIYKVYAFKIKKEYLK